MSALAGARARTQASLRLPRARCSSWSGSTIRTGSVGGPV
ncbi:hypothetical protein I547_0744 [Mycobacterium kansasii 824]|nr:hypothetical protein I547_0744 [Mycobacterium kansasii 824]